MSNEAFFASVEDIDRGPISLASDTSPVDYARYEKLIEKFTVVSNENFGLKAEIDVLKRRLGTSDILDSLIKPYAARAFVFMCAYCAFVGSILLVRGWSLWRFSLSDQVLSLIVGSTAATVVGLVGMVLTGIFIGARSK